VFLLEWSSVKGRASDGGGFVAQRRYFISSIVSILLRQRLYFTYDYYHENRQAYGGGQMVRCANKNSIVGRRPTSVYAVGLRITLYDNVV
jgi:hypothetical protein